MEFQALCELFDTVAPIRRKYPVIGAYVKHLKKIAVDHLEEKQQTELECMKRFLVQNPSLRDRMLDENTFVPGKGTHICFENVFKIGSPELIEAFWLKLVQLEEIVFPDGKPEPPGGEGAVGGGGGGSSTSSDPMCILENNPVFKDVVDQVKSTAALMRPEDDIASFFQTPEFARIVKTIKGNLDKGKYNLHDITSTINDVLGSVTANDMDGSSKEAFESISGGIMSMMSQLKFK